MSGFTNTFEWTSERTHQKHGFIRSLIVAVVREIHLRRTMREVGTLDDAALVDMGISRGGIEDAVRHGRN